MRLIPEMVGEPWAGGGGPLLPSPAGRVGAPGRPGSLVRAPGARRRRSAPVSVRTCRQAPGGAVSPVNPVNPRVGRSVSCCAAGLGLWGWPQDGGISLRTPFPGPLGREM